MVKNHACESFKEESKYFDQPRARHLECIVIYGLNSTRSYQWFILAEDNISVLFHLVSLRNIPPRQDNQAWLMSYK